MTGRAGFSESLRAFRRLMRRKRQRQHLIVILFMFIFSVGLLAILLNL